MRKTISLPSVAEKVRLGKLFVRRRLAPCTGVADSRKRSQHSGDVGNFKQGARFVRIRVIAILDSAENSSWQSTIAGIFGRGQKGAVLHLYSIKNMLSRTCINRAFSIIENQRREPYVHYCQG